MAELPDPENSLSVSDIQQIDQRMINLIEIHTHMLEELPNFNSFL